MSILKKNGARFLDFITFLSTIRGDLASVTAPPYFLAPLSVVEVGSCWTESPSLFVAPAQEPDAQKRALLILRWFLHSLRSQFYIGVDSDAGMRKPLNAFLGELFLAQWTDEVSTTHIVTEQVSHHPPVTACYMYDDVYGIRGEGYTRVEMSFSGSLKVKQTGYAIIHLDKYDEDYLIPFPDCQVKGFLSGKLYPELGGTVHLTSSSGYVSEISFSGEGMFSGTKNTFQATIYHKGDDRKHAIYTAKGQWSDTFTIQDARNGDVVETCSLKKSVAAPLHLPDTAEQDSWETRKAWEDTYDALAKNDFQGIVRAKSKLENAQRAMRKREIAENRRWEPKFFSKADEDPLFEELASGLNLKLQPDRTKGVWKFDRKKADLAVRPFHGELTPLG
ncbi:hypothetical protein TWF225_011973 [Orbilia oligospora]|uniref:Uncharacterized protein n=1 Tax=Orbilia oligospora TaxID=2813651 RepID=A0A7C8P5Q7_ORBOL|nr:hypothetical protein TWF751_011948 [Orbilia oligospora]KAF3167597.1 hypothetical protein TWF225_011973 [Orbilia oligospora]KAF3236853.1 hypothetical protein TWF128_001256 [Orbilia oligospora]KAF3240660.1 hypothetical protein TWF217_000730 [Orbilia oligospora]KAF3285840.1 hypothetical protein TWF132_009060 [Orbilia oligospora]